MKKEPSAKDHTANKAAASHAKAMGAGPNLHEKAERYTSLFENLRDYVYAISAKNGSFTELSPAFEKITGWKPEEWIGKSFDPLVHPDDVGKARSNLKRALDEKEPPVNTLRIRTKSGAYVTLEFKGILTCDRKTGCEIFGVARDVTEREAILAELRDAEEKYRTLMEHATDMIYMIDMEGKFITGNKACEEITGYKLHELIGAHFSKVVVPEYLDLISENINKKLNGKTPSTSYEIEVLTRDGRRIPVEINSSLIFSNGKPVASQGIIRDVSKRKQAENELRAAKDQAEDATRLKDKFVSLVSHDLRSPLSSVMGYMKLASEAAAAKHAENGISYISRSLSIMDGMMNMIDRLLNISRLKTGAIKPAPRFIGARSLAENVIESMAPQAERKGISLVNNVPPGAKIYADRDLAGELLLNLVSNAVKFCGGGASVTISIPQGRSSAITVSDTGAGIVPSIIPNLFRHDVKTTTIGTNGEKGTGLGLPFCKDIMDAHSGTISVESIPGKGSVFTAEFPRIRPVILVAEDNPLERMIIKSHLAQIGAEFMEAENGEQALEIMTRRQPHIVITDLKMPQLDGFGLLDAIKSNPATSSIPVIVITSDTVIETREEAFRRGAADFALKPVDPADLVPRVTRFLI